MADKWITSTEAVQLSNYRADHLRELLREGTIEGRKFGQVWQVNRISLLAYMEKMEKRGDKRGPKKKAS